MSLKPELTADGSKTLFSERYQQTFHSDKGALAESKHVFLEMSGVAEKLRQKQTTNILEVGFGTGLNFFLTADLALSSGASLSFSSLEQSLLARSIVKELNYENILEHPRLLKTYLEFREQLSQPLSGTYVFEFNEVRLELLMGEATTQSLPINYFDAVYQDAFSPDANAELWSEAFFTRLHGALKSQGVMTTYSVKGEVRRRLQGIGFKVEKLQGPVRGKREMLRATKP